MKIHTKLIEDGRFWLVIKWASGAEWPDAEKVIEWLKNEVGKERYDRGPSGGSFGYRSYYDGDGSGFDTFILSLEDGMAFKLRWL